MNIEELFVNLLKLVIEVSECLSNQFTEDPPTLLSGIMHCYQFTEATYHRGYEMPNNRTPTPIPTISI